MAKKKVVKKTGRPGRKPGKQTVNKSAKVREYVDANPSAKPKEIVTALAKQGVAVSPQQVSTIKTKHLGTGGASVRTLRGAENMSVNDLIQAKGFASRVGGVEKAGQLIEALRQLKD